MSLGLFKAPISRRVWCSHDNSFFGLCRSGKCWKNYKRWYAKLARRERRAQDRKLDRDS